MPQIYTSVYVFTTSGHCREEEEKQRALNLMKHQPEIDSAFLELIMATVFPVRKNEDQNKDCVALLKQLKLAHSNIYLSHIQLTM